MRQLKILSLVIGLSMLAALPAMALAKSDKGMMMSEQHRSQVAGVVEQLRLIANQDSNIGEEISQVAQEQSATEDAIATDIEKVENRGKWRTFFFGTDYKSVGALRSAMVTTANHIERLTKAMERTDDQAVKDELQSQITALEATKTSVESFITENESKFSLLGWLVRFFNR